METPLRVAVLSESGIVREGLVRMVGQLGDRAIVVEPTRWHDYCGQVDVVVHDLGGAPGLTRLEELRHLLGLGVPVVALVYDGRASSAHRETAPEGATHLISLDVGAEELWCVIKRAARGSSGGPEHLGHPDLPAGLTHRELTVIKLIGAGLSNKEISARLFVSNNTVKTYIRTAYRKIGVQSRVHAALWAMEHGLVALPARETPPDRTLEGVPASVGRS